MSRSPSALLLAGAIAALIDSGSYAQGVDIGEKVFRKCKACHAVGDGAKNRVGPHLNDIFGRKAGTVDGFKYSKAMTAAGENGLEWDAQSIGRFVAKPRDAIRGTKMAFAGMEKEEDRASLIAYLKTFSGRGAGRQPEKKKAAVAAEKPTANPAIATGAEGKKELAKNAEVPGHGTFHLGRVALDEEITAWDIDIRPDGAGLPDGRGTVSLGESIYTERCAACHGDFGDGRDRWPALAGGQGSLMKERPEKTIGSYWPYLSTVYDYIRRAMPFGDARSLTDDEVYALTAYVLYLNDIVTEEDFELSSENFTALHLPNEDAFIPDDRAQEGHYANRNEPCMNDCIPGKAKVTMRARVLDVTPDSETVEGTDTIE